jgi:hypothetical protein
MTKEAVKMTASVYRFLNSFYVSYLLRNVLYGMKDMVLSQIFFSDERSRDECFP